VAALVGHSWPGNVRELRHVIERAAATCNGSVVSADALTFDRISTPTAPASQGAAVSAESARAASGDEVTGPGPIRTELREFERGRILEALKLTNGNQTRAARLLGVSRRTLYNKLTAHGVERSRRNTLSSSK
jgi:DNA-binding NtrC family response regulator